MIDFRYYLVTDRHCCPDDRNLVMSIEEACKAGVKAVQLRDKDLPACKRYKLAKRLRKITSRYQTKLFINDRLDIALSVRADGIHLPEKGFPPGTIRIFAPYLSIGVSVHSLESAIHAQENGADFLVFGTVFSTSSKQMVTPQGLPRLKNIARQTTIPVFAIGGITPSNTTACLRNGALGVAGISSILRSNNIKQKVTEYEYLLKQL